MSAKEEAIRQIEANEMRVRPVAPKTWEQLKTEGSLHYRGLVQPIDIYRSKGVFIPFALCSIAKYAVRNMGKEINPKDMEKIKHYAELILALDTELKEAGK